MSSTYSFKDTAGVFAHPLVGAFSFSGQIGFGQFSIAMAVEQTVHDIAADGNVMISAVAGDPGSISIEVQQTSALHAFLLAWYNAIKVLRDAGDITNWAAASITLRNLVDGSTHLATGIAPTKIPDNIYAAHGQRFSWVLLCSAIQNLTLYAGF